MHWPITPVSKPLAKAKAAYQKPLYVWPESYGEIGRGGQIRTGDLLFPKQVL